jgi:choline/glycine/proline betaine transport protein
MLASGGKTQTPLWQRVFWASSTGIVAITLLLSGGLGALQTATIASALPFSIILLIAIWGLFKALHIDSTKRVLRHQSATHYSRQHKSAGGWQRRLRSMVMFPRRSHVNRFIDEVVLPGFEEVAVELRKQGYAVEVISGDDKRSKIEVQHNAEVNFVYEIRPRAYVQPDFIMPDDEEEDREERKYFRAEVHLLEGGQDYDIMGWSREEVIDDILDQYEQHMHFLHVVR